MTSARILTVLFDSGGSGCWISDRALPRGCQPTKLPQPITSLTLSGTLSTQHVVTLQGIILPEFDRNKTIDTQDAYVQQSATLGDKDVKIVTSI
jgi:glycerol-3-phosphate O-acyltransferase